MIKKLDENKNYWLVRTAGGIYYEQFVAENYIAIGWNNIADLDLIKNAEKNTEKKDHILDTIRSNLENTDQDYKLKGDREKEAQISRVYNQINRFVNEMSIGDLVLIPSEGSNLIEFGIIDSNAFIWSKNIVDLEENECDYIKRRNVKWLHREKRDELDPYLYKLLYSHHAISNANEYASFIDRTIYKFFIKGNEAHLIFEVEKAKDIYGSDLIQLINSTLGLVDTFNRITGSDFNKDSVQIKINVQSPGLIELFGHIDVIAIIALLIATFIGGKDSIFKVFNFESEGLLSKIQQFIEEKHKYDLEKESIALQKSLQAMQVKIPPELQPSEENTKNNTEE